VRAWISLSDLLPDPLATIFSGLLAARVFTQAPGLEPRPIAEIIQPALYDLFSCRMATAAEV
jgi:hypothetical protein